MPIDPMPMQPGGLPDLNVQPPQSESLLDTLAKVRQLRQEQQMAPLRVQQAQQQVQGGALDLQQKQMEMTSQQGLMKAYLDNNGDVEKTLESAPKYNVLPKDMIGLQSHWATLAKTRAEAGKDQVAIDDAKHDALRAAYQPLFDETDPAKRAALLPAINQRLLQSSPNIRPQDLLQDASDQTVKMAQAAANTHEWVKTQADALKAKAEAQEKTAIAGKTDLEKQLVQHKIDLYNTLTQTPQALAARVAGSIDPNKYPDEYARALNEAKNAPDLEGINKAIETHAQNVSHRESTIATETDPNVLQARTAQAVNTAKATAPIKIGEAIATAKALRMGDNPAVAGVAPASVGQVQNQAIKLDEQYAKEKAATDAMGNFLNLAERGNKAAGSNLPLVGVETLNAINGIKRINSTEISQYQGAGDLLDQIKGKIGKIATGQPIPQDLLNDIRELHQTLGQQSFQNYTDSLNSLNSRTGAKFAPTLPAPDIRKPAPSGSAIRVKRLSDGKTGTIKPSDFDAKLYQKL